MLEWKVCIATVLTVSDQTNNIAQHDAHSKADGWFHWTCLAGSVEAAVRRKSMRMQGAKSESKIWGGYYGAVSLWHHSKAGIP